MVVKVDRVSAELVGEEVCWYAGDIERPATTTLFARRRVPRHALLWASYAISIAGPSDDHPASVLSSACSAACSPHTWTAPTTVAAMNDRQRVVLRAHMHASARS